MTTPSHRLGRLIATSVVAALLCGTADLLFVRLYWDHAGITLQGIGHSIAAGWFGSASSQMGWYGAGIGLASHYFIVAGMALAYLLAARLWPFLWRQPWRYGALYGALLYVLMTWVVVPLSAAPAQPPQTGWMLASIAAHVFLVGIPIALLARRAFGRH